jgi:hypothetical protein
MNYSPLLKEREGFTKGIKMSVRANQSQQGSAVPLLSRLQHLFFAGCIVLGIGATLALVATSPQYYGTQNGIPVMVVAFSTANPALMQAHFIVGVLTVYLLPVSLLTMAWLAMRRSPWLASIAMLVVFITTIPFAAFSAQDALTYDLVGMGNNPLFATIAQRFNDDGVMSYYNTLFIVGTTFAPALVGIALWRSRAVPLWAAVLITFSRFLVFLVYPFTQSFLPGVYIQLLSWTPLLIGSIPAALAMLNVPSTGSQLTPSKETPPPGSTVA